MPKDTPTEIINEIHDVLDKERAALISGNLDEVERLFNVKQSLIERIGGLEAPNKQKLEDVQSKVTRNQELLQSAMEGIKSVADRIAELRKVRQGLDTYDQNGKRVTIGAQPENRVEKRA